MKRKVNGIHVIAIALLMTLIMASSVFATSSWTYQDRISVQTGEPLYINWSSSTSTTGTLTAVNSSYYPADFVLWVGDGNDPTVSNGTATYLYETQTTLEDNTTVVTNRAYQIHLNGAGNIKTTLDGTTEYTITNIAPYGTAPSAGNPTAFNGYLPVGQFARGTGWGAINTDGSNTATGTKKFINGYSSTGVSLGAAGGFVDYDFEAYNTSTHPYGVDFIVYGNAFNGNPEAGAVKVYGFTSKDDNTGEWYDLAGSLYYQGNSMHHKDVSWKLDGNDLKYSITNAGSAASTWNTFITSKAAWWPFNTSKGYDDINGISSGTAFSSDDMTVSANTNTIVFKDICLVKDTNTTNDYQFGYFDVHANGSNYGTAINPYTATNTTQGGDGFDLSWAVDSNGEPVPLYKITKVRLYTTAALTETGSVFAAPHAAFGETSAEVCGIYGVNGTNTASTKNVLITNGSASYKPSHLSFDTIDIQGGGAVSLTFQSSAENLYINGAKVNSPYTGTFNVANNGSKYIQVITQNGTGEPLVTGIKLVG